MLLTFGGNFSGLTWWYNSVALTLTFLNLIVFMMFLCLCGWYLGGLFGLLIALFYLYLLGLI